MSAPITTAYDILVEKIQPKWYILFVSYLPGLLLQVVLAVQGVINHQHTWLECYQTCWKYKKLSCQPPSPLHITSYLKKFPTEVTSKAFSSLLFLPSTVPSTTKPHEQKVGKWGIQEKGFYWTPKISSLVVCGLGTVEKNQICKTRRWLPLTISELARRPSVRGP